MRVIYFCFVISLCQRTFEFLKGNSEEVPTMGKGAQWDQSPPFGRTLETRALIYLLL